MQALADRAAGGLGPAIGHRTAEVLALREGGALDVGGGLRAAVRGGALHFVPSTGPAAPHPPPRHRRMRAVLRDTDIGEILVQADDLQHRVRELGAEISKDYADRDLLLIGVLKGAVFFLADLMREIEVPCEVDFMAVASYGSATESSGVVRILKDLDTPIEGRDVLIVEDIVDSGLTLQYLLRTLEARGPASLEVCALLTKPERRTVDLPGALHRLRDPGQIRHRLRARSRGAVPQPAVRRRVICHISTGAHCSASRPPQNRTKWPNRPRKRGPEPLVLLTP